MPQDPTKPVKQGLSRYKKRAAPPKPALESIPVQPLNTPAVQEVSSEKGWLRQQGDDLWALVSGIPNLVWHTAKAYGDLDYGAVLDGLTRDPATAGRAIRETLGSMIEGATEHYRTSEGKFTPGSIASATYKRPILAGLDALTLLSLGTSAGIKMAPTVGKMAAATRGADAAQVAAKWAGAFQTAKQFPMAAAQRGLRAIGRAPVVKPLLESVGWDEKALKANDLWSTAEIQYTGRGHDQLREMVKHQYGDQFWDDAIDIEAKITHLDPTKYPPELVERMRLLSKTVGQFNRDAIEARLRQRHGAEYNERMLDQAEINHMRARMEQKGMAEAALSDDELRLYRDEVYKRADEAGTGDIQRGLFWHALVENSTSFDDFIYNLLDPTSTQTMRKSGLLDKFMGRGAKYQTNPNIRHEHYIRGYNTLLGRIAGMRSILHDPDLSGIFAKGSQPKGWREVPQPYLRNLDYQAEMLRMHNNRVGQAIAKHGDGSPEALREAIKEAIGGSLDDAEDFATKMAKDMEDGIMAEKAIYVPPGVARFLNQQMSSAGPFARLYDKGMDFWRDAVLTFMPRYYANNLLGNSLLMLFGGFKPGSVPGRHLEGKLAKEMTTSNIFTEGSKGVQAMGAGPVMARVRNKLSDVQYATENRPRALLALQKIGENVKDIKLSDELSRMVGVQGGAMPELERLMELGIDLRELETKLKGSIAAQATISPLPPLELSPNLPPHLKMAARAQYQGSRVPRLAHEIRQAVEGQAGYERFLAQIEPMVKPVEEAYKYVERFLGPYSKITPFSRKYIRRVIPFWTFGSTMARLMALLPIVRPKTTWLYNSMSQMALDAWEDERLPEYLRGSIWLGTGKNGMLYFTRMSGFNPFEAMSERKFGGVPIPALLDPSQGPLVGAVVKMVGGYDQFSHNPPPLGPDEMIDHQGRVWSLDANGKPTRVSPQMKFLDALGEMIPQTSIFNDIMAWSGFQVPGRGPKLYQMPDGTMFDPRHWQWGAANGLLRSFGAAVTPIDLDRVKAQQRAQTIKMIRHLGKQAMIAAEPEERAQFMKMAKHAIDALKGK